MPDTPVPTSNTIESQIAAIRWEQGLALTQVFTEIWLSNPRLAKNAGARIQEFVMPRDEVQRLHLDDLT